MIAVSLLFVLFAIKPGQTISGAEAGRITSEHKNAWCEVYQYANGSKELWITLPNSGWHHPSYIAPADESTLALLAENNISCKTYIQGPGFRISHTGPLVVAVMQLHSDSGGGFGSVVGMEKGAPGSRHRRIPHLTFYRTTDQIIVSLRRHFQPRSGVR